MPIVSQHVLTAFYAVRVGAWPAVLELVLGGALWLILLFNLQTILIFHCPREYILPIIYGTSFAMLPDLFFWLVFCCDKKGEARRCVWACLSCLSCLCFAHFFMLQRTCTSKRMRCTVSTIDQLYNRTSPSPPFSMQHGQLEG
jgi:hypothetical protein